MLKTVIVFFLISSLELAGPPISVLRDKQGQYQGRIIQNGKTSSFYNKQGMYVGRSIQNKSNTQFYNKQGLYTGSKKVVK